MRFISWNVNGLRAAMNKGFMDFFNMINADIMGLQETKLQPEQISLELPGYHQYWHSAIKKGYSGTAVFTRTLPLNVTYDFPDSEAMGFFNEGRVITLEMEDFFFVNCYTPNAQRELTRLSYRMDWDDAFREYIISLDKQKPVVLCGDLNVAHNEIDLRNPRSNRGNAGFTDEERAKFTLLLESGFKDSFRHLHPDLTGAYSWWSYMGNARANNTGWRIDYFVVSERLLGRVDSSAILPEIMGSDHCPVLLEMR